MNKHRAIVPFLVFAGIAAILWAARSFAHLNVAAGSIDFYLISRWLAIAAFCYYAVVRRSLPVWIVAGMLIGIEAGPDWPTAAANLQVLSAIFLHLVKVIIAPLIFSTLVVGIANHPDLKQVGRMGIKALLYFELVTTVALFIGLGAIDLTQAGAGISPPANAAVAASSVIAAPQK